MNRLEFDAYRSDLEELSLGPKDAVAMARIDAAQQQYQVQKDKYERLRSDVIIKLKFLEENKVRGQGGPASPPAFRVERTSCRIYLAVMICTDGSPKPPPLFASAR